MNLKKELKTLTPLQRIKRIMLFNYNRGNNKESVNRVYYNILKEKFNK
jgi:hypothetical protein